MVAHYKVDAQQIYWFHLMQWLRTDLNRQQSAEVMRQLPLSEQKYRADPDSGLEDAGSSA